MLYRSIDERALVTQAVAISWKIFSDHAGIIRCWTKKGVPSSALLGHDWPWVSLASGATLINCKRLFRCRMVCLGSRLAVRLFCALFYVAWFGGWFNTAPAAADSPADNAAIEAFYGEYVGKAGPSDPSGGHVRNLRVMIQPTQAGFYVGWNTVTVRDSEKIKDKSYAIQFEATQRPGIYGSAMQRNKFGDSVPLNPLKGEPYVWARIIGQVLTVYALLITAEGSYEMQIYHRTLTDKGLDLEFFRYREGEPVKVITGTLERVTE